MARARSVPGRRTPAQPGRRPTAAAGRHPPAAERVLALQRGAGNRATGRMLARREGWSPAGDGWTLLYKDKFGDETDEDGYVRWRRIKLDDLELERDYIDAHIDFATVDVELDTGHFDEIVVHYTDGRTKTFKRGKVPTTYYYAPGRNTVGVGAVHLDGFERHDEDGFIYPAYQNAVALTPAMVPNLTSIRDQAEAKAKDLAKLRELAQVAGAFLNILGMYGAVLGELHSIKGAGEEHAGSLRLRGGRRKPSAAGATPGTEPSSRQTGPASEPEQHVSMTLGEHGGEHAGGKGAPKGKGAVKAGTTERTSGGGGESSDGKSGAKKQSSKKGTDPTVREDDRATTSGPVSKSKGAYVNHNPKATAKERSIGELLQRELPEEVSGAPEAPGKRSADYRFQSADGTVRSADLYEPTKSDPQKIVGQIFGKSGQAEIAVVALGEGESANLSLAGAQQVAHDVVSTPDISIDRVIVLDPSNRIIVDRTR